MVDNENNKMVESELFSLEAIYTQDPDSCSNESSHELVLSTDNAGAGVYYILSTKRWAFESVDELEGIIKDFMKRADGIE
jgi:hypothetical protein